MDSLYFDDSLYENKMHFKINEYLDEVPLNQLEEYDDPDREELRIGCDNNDDYNSMLDKLYHYKDNSISMYGEMNNPMEIIIEEDPRLKYRQFDESLLEEERRNETDG